MQTLTFSQLSKFAMKQLDTYCSTAGITTTDLCWYPEGHPSLAIQKSSFDGFQFQCSVWFQEGMMFTGLLALVDGNFVIGFSQWGESKATHSDRRARPVWLGISQVTISRRHGSPSHRGWRCAGGCSGHHASLWTDAFRAGPAQSDRVRWYPANHGKILGESWENQVIPDKIDEKT